MMQEYPTPPASDREDSLDGNIVITGHRCACICTCSNCGRRLGPAALQEPDWEFSWLRSFIMVLAGTLLTRFLFCGNYVETVLSLKRSLSPGEFTTLVLWPLFLTIFYDASHLLASLAQSSRQARLAAKKANWREWMEECELRLEHKERQSIREFQLEMEKLKCGKSVPC